MRQKTINLMMGVIVGAGFLCLVFFLADKALNSPRPENSSGRSVADALKTHLDEENGYKISYSVKFAAEERIMAAEGLKFACGRQLGESVKIAADDKFASPVYGFAVYSNPRRLSLKDFFICVMTAEKGALNEDNIKNVRAFNIGKQNIPAMKFWMEDLTDTVLADYGGNIYVFTLDKNENAQGISAEFDSILATAEFFDSKTEVFCSPAARNEYGNGLTAFSLPIANSQAGEIEIFAGCFAKNTAERTEWQPFENVSIYDLAREGSGDYQSVWSGNTGAAGTSTTNGFGWNLINGEPSSVDIDGDNKNEIILSGVRGGREECAQNCKDWCLYVPSEKDVFCASICEGWSQDGLAEFAQKDCAPVKSSFLLPDANCKGEKYSVKCFDSRLKDQNYQVYRDYLDKAAVPDALPGKSAQ